MVCDSLDLWGFGLCPSSGILQNTTCRKLDPFPSSGEGGGKASLLGPLERANPKQWTHSISKQTTHQDLSKGYNRKMYNEN
jgi:hypothetical protein